MKGEREKPLGLDMPFADALTRFIGTNPAEVESLAIRKKKDRPKAVPGVDEVDPEGPVTTLD